MLQLIFYQAKERKNSGGNKSEVSNGVRQPKLPGFESSSSGRGLRGEFGSTTDRLYRLISGINFWIRLV